MDLDNELLTIKYLIAMTMADIDIFLLQNEDQTKDNDKEYFTREEIRSQLKKTSKKVISTLKKNGIDVDELIKGEIII